MNNSSFVSDCLPLPCRMSKMTQDAKKDEFRKYLEKAGVLELLTKSLVQLYEEPDKPQDALSYLKNSVGGSQDDKTVIAKLREENDQLKKKCKEIEAEKSKLESRVKELQEGDKETEQVEKMAEDKEDKSAPATEAVAEPSSTAPEVEGDSEDSPAAKTGEETPAVEASAPAAPEEPMETETAASEAATPVDEPSDSLAKSPEKETEAASATAE